MQVHWRNSDQKNLAATHSFPHLSELKQESRSLIFLSPQICQGQEPTLPLICSRNADRNGAVCKGKEIQLANFLQFDMQPEHPEQTTLATKLRAL